MVVNFPMPLPHGKRMVSSCPNELWPVFAGFVTFYSISSLSTLTQKNILRVTTGTNPMLIPWSCGFATVCLASVASHKAAVAAHEYMAQFKARHGIHSQPLWDRLPKQTRDQIISFDHHKKSLEDLFRGDSVNIGAFGHISRQTMGICIVGLFAFKILGGRFYAIAPSSFTAVGSFARKSIPASATGYATPAEGKIIAGFGSRFGCHTCGSKQAPFISDHVPPLSAAKQMNIKWYNKVFGKTTKHRFFPQCQTCSNTQSHITGRAVLQNKDVMLAGGGKAAHFHGRKIRLNHLAGGAVAGVTVAGATEEEIAQGNPSRYRSVQRITEEFFDFLKRLNPR